MSLNNHLPQPQRILIVEDDPFAQMLYQSYLASKPVHCSVVGSIAALDALLASSPPSFDLVLLDQELPDGQGIDRLAQLRQRSPMAAIIMITGVEDPDFFVRAFEQGVDDYAVKPVNLDLLWIKAVNAHQRTCMQQQIAQQQQELNQWYATQQQELRLTDHLYQHFVAETHQSLPGVHTYVKPSAVFSGDLVLSRCSDQGYCYVLLADATGHGLSAAVSLMPVMEQFRQGVDSNASVSQMALMMNDHLHRSLPADRFVAVFLVRLDPFRRRIQLWNGGMPSAYLLTEQGEVMHQVASNSMALGILAQDKIRLQTQDFALDALERLFFFSDGLVETPLAGGELPDKQQVLDCLALPSSEHSMQALRQWIGAQLLQRADDDISAVLLDLPLVLQHAQAHQTVGERDGYQRTLRFDLQGDEVRRFEPRVEVAQVLANLPLAADLRVRVLLTVQELYLNALEHGLLLLDSAIKEQQGFDAYYQLREQRMHGLQSVDRISLQLSLVEGRQLSVAIEDTGPGFSWRKPRQIELQCCYGRGLQLVQNMTDRLVFNEIGNRIFVEWYLHPDEQP